MAVDPAAHQRLLDAALVVIAEKGWRRLSMADIAAEATTTLAEVFAAFPTRAHLLTALLARINWEVLEGPAAESGESGRDRLFELLMRRFDSLQAHKAAYTALIRDLPRDPQALLTFLPGFVRSMAWMVEASGVSSVGVRGLLRTKVIALVYLNALRTWVGDDSIDMARTMATLDRGLSRAETLLRRLGGRERPSRRPPPPGESDPSLDNAIPD